MTTIDQIDKKILYALSLDSRSSVEKLAEMVSLSPTPVRRRIQRLRAKGFLRGYTILVDMKKCGLSLQLYVFIKLQGREEQTLKEFEDRIQRIPEIFSCQLVTGVYDYILTLYLKDMDTYNDFLRSVLSSLPGVFSIETSVIIGTVKDAVPLPTKLQFRENSVKAIYQF